MLQRGFTLIELLVALAIFAIISAVAVPIYTKFSVRAYQREAQADLLDCAGGLERYANEDNRFGYTGATLANVCSPKSGAHYVITIVSATDDTYSLQAAPIAGTAVDGTPTFTLNSAGDRSW